MTSTASVSAAMRVLVVDDEANVRFAVERRLKREGLEVESASTVAQARERVRAGPFDVVVCDLRMPGGDGTEMLRWLGSYSPSTHVIVVSAFVTKDIRERFPISSTLRILEKPVDLEHLVSILHDIGPRPGFFGNAIEVELFDYVQMLAVSGRDRLVEVVTPVGKGHIWFEHGDVAHVEFGEYRGETAFYKMLAENRGTFHELFFRSPPLRTVTRSSTHLLMEAAKQADEGTLGQSGTRAIPEVVADETSFAGVAASTAARAEPPREMLGSSGGLDELVLPADDDDDDDTRAAPVTELSSSDLLMDEPSGASPVPSPPPPPDPSESVSGHSIFTEPDTRQALVEQFWQHDGVNGVAIVSSSGKVLADEMGEYSALVTLAGFYMRGSARLARTLGYKVFDAVVASSETQQQMVMVSMGGSSAVLSVEPGVDPEHVRDAIMGAVP